MLIPAITAAFLANSDSLVSVFNASVQNLKIPETLSINALTDIGNAYSAVANQKTNPEQTALVLNERQSENTAHENGYVAKLTAARNLPPASKEPTKGWSV